MRNYTRRYIIVVVSRIPKEEMTIMRKSKFRTRIIRKNKFRIRMIIIKITTKIIVMTIIKVTKNSYKWDARPGFTVLHGAHRRTPKHFSFWT